MRTLASWVRRVSAREPAGGSTPSWRATSPLSRNASRRSSLPSALTVRMSQPSISRCAPLGTKPWKVPGTGECAGRPPLHRDPAAVARTTDDVEDLPAQVGEGAVQLLLEVAHAVGRAELSLANEALDAAGGPHGEHGVQVAGGDRLEIAPGDVCAGHPSAGVYAGNIVPGHAAQTRARAWRAGYRRAVAPAPAAAVPGRAALQRVGDRARGRGRAGRHRNARAWVDGRPRAGVRSGGAVARSGTARGLHARPLRSLGTGGDDLRPDGMRNVDAPQPRARVRSRDRPGLGARPAARGRAPERRARVGARALRRARPREPVGDRAGDRARPRARGRRHGRFGPGRSGGCTRRRDTRPRTSACSRPSGGC